VRNQWETFKVKGKDVLEFIKKIIHEGNVRRVVIRQGSRTVVEFPVTVGVVGAVAIPELAMIGTVAALLTECTIQVERPTESASRTPPRPPGGARRRGGQKA